MSTGRGRLSVCVLIAATVFSPLVRAAGPGETGFFQAAVTVPNIRAHQQAFQTIADANGGTRAAGTAGYDESAEYVTAVLESHGYEVAHQLVLFSVFFEFTLPLLEQIEPTPITYPPYDDSGFYTLIYSGSGDVYAGVTAVDLLLPPAPDPNTSTSGCESSDFAGFPAGNIALLQRGFCSFRQKAENALAAGASGVIIFNEGQEGRTSAFQGTLSEPQFSLPAVGASFAVGEALAALPEDALLHMVVDAFVDERAGVNVFAEREGCDESVLMIGAHLDSVAAGPGMNDNGSGSATVLELAVQMAVQKISPRRTVRFAWWTAEELGLIGSDFYVNTLPPDDLARIAYYLNFDMVGSPNFVRFVYDGDGTSGGYVFPTGSEAIEYLFRDYFTELNLPVEELALTASDNFPFAEVGVPVGGLFTGAGGLKTAEEANIYGGQADIAYDPCYHLACDDFDNVNLVALDQMSDAAAHALLSLAQDSSFCLSETFASAAWFVQCMAGPTVEVGACCLCSDLNGNHTVSLDDFAEWQNRFGGSP